MVVDSLDALLGGGVPLGGLVLGEGLLHLVVGVGTYIGLADAPFGADDGGLLLARFQDALGPGVVLVVDVVVLVLIFVLVVVLESEDHFDLALLGVEVRRERGLLHGAGVFFEGLVEVLHLHLQVHGLFSFLLVGLALLDQLGGGEQGVGTDTLLGGFAGDVLLVEVEDGVFGDGVEAGAEVVEFLVVVDFLGVALGEEGLALVELLDGDVLAEEELGVGEEEEREVDLGEDPGDFAPGDVLKGLVGGG